MYHSFFFSFYFIFTPTFNTTINWEVGSSNYCCFVGWQVKIWDWWIKVSLSLSILVFFILSTLAINDQDHSWIIVFHGPDDPIYVVLNYPNTLYIIFCIINPDPSNPSFDSTCWIGMRKRRYKFNRSKKMMYNPFNLYLKSQLHII